MPAKKKKPAAKKRAAKKKPAAKKAGFSAAEKAAMKERAAELKAEAKKADGEKTLMAAVNKMPGSEKAMGKKLHKLVMEAAPSLSPKTWYGMPAWADSDGKVVCFFQNKSKFDARYSTFGFNDRAGIESGDMWPTTFALTKLGPSEQKKLQRLVKKAAG